MIYCTKCGTQLTDDALFCHNCGNKIANQAPYVQQSQPYVQVQQPYAQPQQPYVQTQQPYAQPQQVYGGQPYSGQGYSQPIYGNAAPAPQKSKTPFIIVGAIIAVILLSIILFTKISTGGKGYESAFSNLCQAVNTGNIDKLYKCIPPSSEAAIKTMLSIGGTNESEVIDDLFGSMGNNIHVDYRIIDAVPLDSYVLSDYQDYFFGYEITDGYDVQVALVVTIDGYTEEEIDDYVILKIGNRWCFADFMY